MYFLFVSKKKATKEKLPKNYKSEPCNFSGASKDSVLLRLTFKEQVRPDVEVMQVDKKHSPGKNTLNIVVEREELLTTTAPHEHAALRKVWKVSEGVGNPRRFPVPSDVAMIQEKGNTSLLKVAGTETRLLSG